jgi:ASCH domain
MDIDHKLTLALHDYSDSGIDWGALVTKGCNDAELTRLLKAHFGDGMGGITPDPQDTGWYGKGGKTPRFWDKHNPDGKPVLQGKALVQRVRLVLGIAEQSNATEYTVGSFVKLLVSRKGWRKNSIYQVVGDRNGCLLLDGDGEDNGFLPEKHVIAVNKLSSGESREKTTETEYLKLIREWFNVRFDDRALGEADRYWANKLFADCQEHYQPFPGYDAENFDYAFWKVFEELCPTLFQFSTSAQGQESALALQQPSLASPSKDSLKSTHIAQAFSVSDSLESGTMETCINLPSQEDSDCAGEKLMSYALPHLASHSASKETEEEPQMSGTVSPASSESSTISDQSLLHSKMSSASLVALMTENQTSPTLPSPVHISSTSSTNWTRAGTMHNGLWSAAEPLAPPSLEPDCFWLESPGALSSRGKSRPPGLNRLEAQLQKLKLLKRGECLNPRRLERWFSLPDRWTDPEEKRSAWELLAAIASPANDAAPSVTDLTPALPKSPLSASSTSTAFAAGDWAEPVKAISLWQPWASLIILGYKHFETRSWPTSYRGKLLICSAKKDSEDLHSTYLYLAEQCGIDTTKYPWKALPKGYAVAICDLVDCVKMTPAFIASQSETQLRCGDWKPGRFAWKLENIQPIEPIPIRGKQGLWDVDLPMLEQIQALPEKAQPKRRHRPQGQAQGWIERQTKYKQLSSGERVAYHYHYFRWEAHGKCLGRRIEEGKLAQVEAAIAAGKAIDDILRLLC